MQKLKIGFVLFLLVIIGSSCKKINQITEKAKEHYTVSGVIYDVDGETPVKNWQVELFRTYVPKLTKKNEPSLGQTVTDENGFFSISYAEIPAIDDYGLYLFSQVPGQFTGSHIVECIPPNENVEVYGSLRPQEKLILEVKNQQLFKNDTLFFNLYDPSKPYVEIQGNEWWHDLKVQYAILGYDSIFNVKNIIFHYCYSNDFKGVSSAHLRDTTTFFFAVGRNEYLNVFYNLESYPENKVTYYPKPFPEVSEIVIDLKK